MELRDHAYFDQILTELRTTGLTHNDMQEMYNLTRWGARKLGNQEILDEDETGNHEKLFKLTHPKDDKHAAAHRETLGAVEVPVQNESEVNHEEQRRDDYSTKQTRTNKMNTYLTKLEEEVKNTETPSTDYSNTADKGGKTMLIHETDPHFSAHVKNRAGQVVYDAETAALATSKAFDWYLSRAMQGENNVDEIVLMLGGDLVEGEDIYEGQPHKITDTLEGQIKKARRCYYEQIKKLRTAYPSVSIKIVCVSGNHGDLGKTGRSNADDIIYSMLEDMIDLSDLQNIKFVKSDRSDYTTFTYRGGKYKGYLTHGENRSNHIGTSSPQSDWLAIKDDIGFDAAWRGHYHTQKVENVNGAPVCMTNSRKPGDDYTDKIATFGKTGNAVYFATDEEPLAEVKTETEVLNR